MSAAVQYKEETFRGELRTLFEKYNQLVYKAAYGITGRPQDADDVVQTVFLELLVKQPPTDFLHNPPGYLYRTAILEALKLLRSRRRRRISVDDVNSLQIPAPSPTPPNPNSRTTFAPANSRSRRVWARSTAK
jgi:RNA polymerase sigma factor (sigma-70 family)